MIKQLSVLSFLALSAWPVLAHPAAVQTQAPPSSPDALSGVEDRMRKVQELINQLELQSERVKADMDKQRPQPIGFATGNITLEQVMAWPVPNFSTLPGQTAHLGFNLNPLPEVKGYIEMEMFGSVAVNRLLPQQEVKMERNNSHFLFKKGEIKFEQEYVSLRAFHMVPRAEWYEEGDLFWIMPAADDTNKYFRQSGRGVPSGFQGSFKNNWLEGLEIWAGNELRYGAPPEAIARYRKSLGFMDVMLMGQWVDDSKLLSGRSVESNQEAWLRFPLGAGMHLETAALRKGTRVGQKYTELEKVAAGTGFIGTEWNYKYVETTESDAWGAKLRLKGNGLPLLDNEEFIFEYAGPLAGNRMQAKGLLEFRPRRILLFSAEATWQKPIVGTMPLISVGPPGITLGTIGGPRPFGSVVAVSQDPISGQNNREMTDLVLTVEYNPGQGWFYKYRPRVVEGWNLNDQLATPFSLAFQARMFNYPGGSDLGSYVNATGTVVGEAGGTGLLPTNGYLGEYKLLMKTQAGPVGIWAEAATGKDFMGLSPNFTSVNAMPAINYLRADLGARWGRLALAGGYAEDVWGPDDWYRTFGLAIPTRYTASLALNFGRSEFAIRYEGWRDKDTSKYRLFKNTIPTLAGPVDVEAPIDQVFTSYTVNF